MSLDIVGALAAALAATCLALVPLGEARVLTFSIDHPERPSLSEVGWTVSPAAWEGIRFLCALLGSAIAASLDMLPLGLIAAAGPSILLRSRVTRAREERARQTVALLQMVVASMRSGGSMTEALRFAVSSGPESRSGPFALALRAFDLGQPLDTALQDAGAQARDRRIVLGIDALSLCVAEQLPLSRCIQLIGSVIDRLVFEQRVAADVSARTSGLLLQILLLAALVPGLAVYLAITVPGLKDTLNTPLGRFVLLPLAAIFETAGIVASRRVVKDIT